jgi:alcohol dehydrogenase YqhD (iron-dependent ADH family)
MKFTWANPTRIIFGVGEIARLGEEASQIGSHALIVTGKSSTRKSGLLDRVMGLLKEKSVKSTVFDEIEPNPRTTTIDRGAEIAHSKGCDFVIGLGGGSPMDAAKGIALAAVNEGPFWDYVYHGEGKTFRQATKALPIVAVPTLAATGSEADSGGVFTNWETHEKAGAFGPVLFPKFAIVDPELTVSVSLEYTGDGGIDIISHVLESYCSSTAVTPLQDRFSEGVIRTVMQFLGRAMKDGGDIEARTHLSWASTIALCGLVNAGRVGGFPLHAMEHALSGYYDISHGRGLAILMPRLMRYTAEETPGKYVLLARNLFFADVSSMTPADAANLGIDKFVEWLESVNMSLRLSDVGIGSEKIEAMADDTVRIYGRGRDYIDNARTLYREDIVKIYEMSL